MAHADEELMERRPPPRETDADRASTDCGATLIEILVSIVLLGTTVVAVLAATHMSVIGTRIERDHAKAYQWLQSANGVLQAAERISCEAGEAAMRLGYQDTVRTGVVNPPGWDDRQLTVLEPVKVWDGSLYWDPAVAPKPCYEEDGYRLQLITLQVTDPAGTIIETIQVVKRD